MITNLAKIRAKAKKIYKDIKPVYSPYFQEEISFNSEGFNHIRYKGDRKERHRKVQEIRYKYLHFAPKIIKLSKTLQEYDEASQFIVEKINKRKDKVLKKVKYYGFIAIIEKRKFKVIVRQVGNGNKHFWSIIPNWKTRQSSDGKKLIQNYTGNLSED